MSKAIMPKATAVWMVENSSLTFEQIADFCGMHLLEVQAIADADIATDIMGIDPVTLGQLTRDEIKRCEGDSKARLRREEMYRPKSNGTRRRKYVSISKKQDKPNAILWFLRHHPEIPPKVICKVCATTMQTVNAIANGTHARMNQIKACDPVILGICSQIELDDLIAEFAHIRNSEMS